MSTSVRMRLLVFVVVGGLAVVVAGVRYAGLWKAVRPSSYELRVELARSGGIFDLAVVAGVAGEHAAEMEETLVALPYALASALTPGRGGRAHFSFQGAQEPRPCREGYVPPGRWRSPHDLEPVPMDDSQHHCTERGGVLPRGSNSELDEE